MKRISAVILALVMIFLSLNISALSADTTRISVGDTVYVVADKTEGINYFTFVPEETGYYCFYSEGDYDTVGCILDAGYNVIARNDDYEDYNFYICCELYGGREYILVTSLYEQYGGETYKVCAKRAETANEIFIFHGGETTGYVGGTLIFEAMSEPEGSYMGTLTWSTDNSKVATVYETEGNLCAIYFAGEGTATVTVSSKELGLSDSIEVTAVEIPQIAVGEVEELSFGTVGGVRYFSFTPKISGTYAAYTVGSYNTVLTPYDGSWYECSFENEIIPGTDDSLCRLYMKAGKTYYFEIYAYGGENPDCSFAVSFCESPEDVYVYNYDGVYWGCEGETLDLNVAMMPFYSSFENCEWESSDPSVVKVVDSYSGDCCRISFVSPGEAYITATTPSGLSDSVLVECVETESIELNEKKNVGAGSPSIRFKFVPEADGYYSFISNGSNRSQGTVYDSEWNFINGSETGFYSADDFSVQAYMEKGKVYYLEAVRNETQMTSPFEVSVSKCTPAENVAFACGAEVYGYVGDSIELELILDGNTSFVEDCRYTISDRYVGEIADEFDGGCYVYLNKAGRTNVTVTTESGLTATCEIIVSNIQYEKITLDNSVKVETDKYREKYFTFTPKESGSYTVVATGGADTYCVLLDDDMNELDFDDDKGKGLNFSLEADLIAGQTYAFKTGFYTGNGAESYEVKIVKSQDAEKVYIDSERVIKATVGQILYLTADFSPEGALSEAVYWETEGRDIIAVTYEQDNLCEVYVMGEGVAYLRVYSENGLCDTVTVVCGSVMTTAGDVNGDAQVNAKDTNVLRRHVAGAYDAVNLLTSDMNDDTVIDSRDSNLLKRLVAGR